MNFASIGEPRTPIVLLSAPRERSASDVVRSADACMTDQHRPSVTNCRGDDPMTMTWRAPSKRKSARFTGACISARRIVVTTIGGLVPRNSWIERRPRPSRKRLLPMGRPPERRGTAGRSPPRNARGSGVRRRGRRRASLRGRRGIANAKRSCEPHSRDQGRDRDRRFAEFLRSVMLSTEALPAMKPAAPGMASGVFDEKGT